MHQGRTIFRSRQLTWLAAATLFACSEATTGPGAAPELRLPSHAAASLAAFTGDMRIGVVPSASQIFVGATGSYVVRDKVTRTTLLTGGSTPAKVTLETNAKTHSRLQVTCTSESGRNARIAAAEAHGVTTFSEHVASANCWRVFLGEFPADAPFSVRNPFRNQMIALGLAGTDSFWRSVTIGGDDTYFVSLGATLVTTRNRVVVEATSGNVTINGQQYRGRAEVGRNSGTTLAGINELPIEQYLYGVVPRELPPVPYGEFEAQKAQAVAARTYSLANLGKQAVNGYDLMATTADQVYGGLAAEHAISTAAVDATSGLVATYDGAPFTTFYHSTSGGFTANSEDVFTTAFAFLRGVPDAERGRALEHVPSLEVFKRHANPTNLRAAAEGDFESDWSRYHRWVVEWTAEEMAEILSASFNTTVKQVNAITVIDRADQGRVLRIVFDTDAGPLEALKDNIRSRLRYYDASGTASSLRSTLFWIEPVIDPKTKAITGWKAYGGGWGHGVGMSQTGAVGMAERGYDFERILKHYFQGIELARWY